MKARRKKFAASVPSMAMGDIAFNLLIFFVILARAQDDSHIQWQAATAKTVETSGNFRVSVVIDVENQYFVNGSKTGDAQLASTIESLLGDAPAGERTVLLKVHKEATANFFEPAIEAISEAGGDIVHILEKEGANE
ncbi:MAG: biopolymer transporter ExbD [Pirellulaceae bacterium]|jgi:biopolymer transport protein ExbD|nr:biopolymer transporter ExbD [Pirellulaceae bacterium]